MASPLCQVKFGAGAYASTTNGINATAGSVVVINLISSIGAPTWAIACVYADDLSTVASVNASLTIDPVGRTATFTAPVAGRGYIFQSVINAGNNLATNQPDPTTATTFGIWVPTASGARVLIPNETFESSATSGWVADVNFPIRNPSTGGGTTPTGTGFATVTAGAFDAAASANVSYAGGGLVVNASGFVSFGATPAAAGTIRLSYAAIDTIIGAKDSGGVDRGIISRTSADSYLIGPAGTGSALNMAFQGNVVAFNANSSFALATPGVMSLAGSTTSFCSFGAGAGATGGLRFKYGVASSVWMSTDDNVGGSRPYVAIDASFNFVLGNPIINTIVQGTNINVLGGIYTLLGFSGGQLNIGTNVAYSTQVSAVGIYAAASVGLGIGGTTYFYCNVNSANAEFARPIGGGSFGSNLPYREAKALISPTASNAVTLTAAQYCCPFLVFKAGGGVTASCFVTTPNVDGEKHTVKNACGFNIVIGAVTVLTGTTAQIIYDADSATWSRCT